MLNKYDILRNDLLFNPSDLNTIQSRPCIHTHKKMTVKITIFKRQFLFDYNH